VGNSRHHGGEGGGLVGHGVRGFVAGWRPVRSSRSPSASRFWRGHASACLCRAVSLLWTIAPVAAYWLSVPVGARVRPLSDRERRILRRTARKTWRYFETFVTEPMLAGPRQLSGRRERPKLARRTSPTNIGMSMLSTLRATTSATCPTDVVVRAERNVVTLEGLERIRDTS
jgi:hypothetical protein